MRSASRIGHGIQRFSGGSISSKGLAVLPAEEPGRDVAGNAFLRKVLAGGQTRE